MILSDKVAIVTGSCRGIGSATVRLLARNGARVVVNYKQNRGAGEKTPAEIRKDGGTGILVQADVTDPDQVTAMVERAERELGPVEIPVNNANMSFPVAPFLEYPWDGFRRKLLHEVTHANNLIPPQGGGARGYLIPQQAAGNPTTKKDTRPEGRSTGP